MASNVLKVKAKFETVDVEAALKGTEFAKQSKRISEYLKRKNMVTMEQIENLPRLGHVLGCDVYSLVAAIREGVNKPAETIVTRQAIMEDKKDGK